MSDDLIAPVALEARLLLDTFRDVDVGLVWLDEDGHIVLANDCFAAWTGIAADALAGRPLSAFAPDLPPGYRESRQADAPAARMTLSGHGGAARVLELRAHRVADGEHTLTALLLLPIADRVQAENIDELQREVLESIALGRPLRAVLNLLCRRVEALAPEVACSVSGSK